MKTNSYLMFLQNNATKQVWAFENLINAGRSNMELMFKDFTLPVNCPNGEYTGYVVWNIREDITIEESRDIMKTKFTDPDGNVVYLKDLNPHIFLCKVAIDFNTNESKVNEYEKESPEDNPVYIYDK